MATNNRGGKRGRSEGRNQHSGIMSTARDNPLATAAAVGGAVAAGVFLWSRRNQISEQIGIRGGGRSQAEIAEEALTLKETGKTA
jgi:hypothetical protein